MLGGEKKNSTKTTLVSHVWPVVGVGLSCPRRRRDPRASHAGLRVIKQVFVGGLDPGESAEAGKEAKLLIKLKHPHILACFDVFVERGYVNIVTE